MTIKIKTPLNIEPGTRAKAIFRKMILAYHPDQNRDQAGCTHFYEWASRSLVEARNNQYQLQIWAENPIRFISLYMEQTGREIAGNEARHKAPTSIWAYFATGLHSDSIELNFLVTIQVDINGKLINRQHGFKNRAQARRWIRRQGRTITDAEENETLIGTLKRKVKGVIFK